MIFRQLSAALTLLFCLFCGLPLLLVSAVAAATCTGDCDGGGSVTVDEVLHGINIALGNALVGECTSFDANSDDVVTVDEVLSAVSNALNGCVIEPQETATLTPLATPTESAGPPTPTVTPLAATATPTATSIPATPTPSVTPGESSVPVTAPELFAWLQAGSFHNWPAESAMHASPIHGTVRVFVNPALFDSLQSAQASHPAGAAAVKELYSRGNVIGWSVMVKVQDDSAHGAGWFWYEGFGPSPGFSGNGLPVCTGCHSAGRDYFRSQFPLQ